MPSALRRAFVAATLAWTALLVVAPFVATRSHATPFGTALVVAVYSIGALVCHQLPERSYRLWTAQMPVCARCAGIYLGAAFAAVAAIVRSPERLALLQSRVRALHWLALRRAAVTERASLAPVFSRAREVSADGRKEREPFRRADARRLLALAATPTALTLLFEWTTGSTPSNTVRLAAGIPIGVAVAWLVVSVSADQVN